MRLGLSLSLTQRQTQRPLQSYYQELLDVFWNEQYEPERKCPRCSQNVTLEDIIAGFRNDPDDLTTECPHCKARFIAKAVFHRSNLGYGTIQFICPIQVKSRLPDWLEESPSTIKKESPSVYASAVLHYGSLASAFKSIGLVYEKEVLPDWKKKVVPFLGSMPDVVIASVAGVSRSSIQNYRSSLGIKAWKQ